MKRKNIAHLTALLIMFFVSGCSKILDENPRGIFTPDYFKTNEGIQGGITSLYGHLRYWYGNGYVLNAYEAGTDEATWGQNSDNNVKQLDFSGVSTIDPSTANTGLIWGVAFPDINTASGIIENATDAGISADLIAEARFFRAFDYFLLVQTFGGVPLDLGAGELKFNSSTVRTSKRNTVPEVYTKAIFPDLLQAISDLPATNTSGTGRIGKNVARLYLAKAYLTYGWWLENPNNIPTYPATDRTDPDGHDATWYYQQAYDVATTAINDPGPYGLQTTFYDVSVATNDRNNETMLYADHTQTSALYNGDDLGYSSAPVSGTGSYASWFTQFNYTGLYSSTSNTEWKTVNSVQREAVQSLGRPWTMLAPPHEIFKNTFADKTNDSRYDGTFVTVYRGNWTKGGVTQTTLYNANFLPVGVNDPILTFLNDDIAGIDYSNSVFNSNIGAGILPGRADFVIAPSGISRICYPGNWKLGTYRTDNGSGLGQPNGSNTRPVAAAKFSELFLIAAEAAVKGATTKSVTGATYTANGITISTSNDGTAKGLVNVLRARAGHWRFSNAQNATYLADNSAALVAATPATVDVDYILAERSREYIGEGYRWLDLVRTQKWAEFGSTFTISGGINDWSNWKNHTPETVTRTITPNYYLRPIPQSQLDGMEMTPEEKSAYQNPGY